MFVLKEIWLENFLVSCIILSNYTGIFNNTDSSPHILWENEVMFPKAQFIKK